jgi:hypothetical protein
VSTAGSLMFRDAHPDRPMMRLIVPVGKTLRARRKGSEDDKREGEPGP